MSSVVPIFRDRGFDSEATQILGNAYDIACRSLHRKGQPPVVQELLAKKIIEAAQHGERDPDRLAGIALGLLGPLHREVSQRFGLIPNFFLSTPDAPEIVEKLWDFAKSAYLDSPIPALFKERLFVFLSRFCRVRYCIARHCGFLVGYGYASGDALATRQSIEHGQDHAARSAADPPRPRRRGDRMRRREFMRLLAGVTAETLPTRELLPEFAGRTEFSSCRNSRPSWCA